MAIAINGAGTITGLTAGGLPDASIITADIANSAVTDGKIAGMASSKLTGTLPAISGTNLTNLDAADLVGSLPAISGASLTNLPAGVSTGFIGGLTITNNGSDGDHDIDIAVGSARDYTDAVTMTQGTAALTKRIDATWVVGNGNGGLDSTDTVAANTGYGVYLIRRSDTGVVDVLISSDMTAAGSALTMPTSYNQKRLIGWVMTNASSNIYVFTQSGDYFRLGDNATMVNDSTITSNTFEDLTLPIPPLCLAHMTGNVYNASESSAFGVFSIKPKGTLDPSDQEQTAWAAAGFLHSGANFYLLTGRGFVLCNSNSQVEYYAREAAGTATLKIELHAIQMLSRSNP